MISLEANRLQAPKPPLHISDASETDTTKVTTSSSTSTAASTTTAAAQTTEDDHQSEISRLSEQHQQQQQPVELQAATNTTTSSHEVNDTFEIEEDSVEVKDDQKEEEEVEEDDEDEDEDDIDYSPSVGGRYCTSGSSDVSRSSLNGSCHSLASVVFMGDNVIVGNGSLLNRRNKQLKISFDENSAYTYEYPSEEVMMSSDSPFASMLPDDSNLQEKQANIEELPITNGSLAGCGEDQNEQQQVKTKISTINQETNGTSSGKLNKSKWFNSIFT